MSFIIDFYKNLDTVNLFIFWGVIIVVTLLLIFAIIITNKNKKLERIIENNGINIDEYNDNDIPAIKLEKNKDENMQTEKIIVDEKKAFTDKVVLEHNNDNLPIMPDMPKEQERKFVAEEHVIEYNEKPLEVETNKEINIIGNEKQQNQEIDIPTKPYQRNILREISHNQTSPIGITNNELNVDKETTNAHELYENLTANVDVNNKVMPNNYDNHNRDAQNNNFQQEYKHGNYLEELAKNNPRLKNEVNRTEYELKQEEDAIISYEELMKKKDDIKTIDEEEAVISINELMKKKKESEKLYNINENEEDNKFIDELKNFRSDL